MILTLENRFVSGFREFRYGARDEKVMSTRDGLDRINPPNREPVFASNDCLPEHHEPRSRPLRRFRS
jgi:hypothetical protein